MIILFARGDRNVTNPTTTAVLRPETLRTAPPIIASICSWRRNPTTPLSVNDPHVLIHLVPSPFLALPPEVRAAATAVAFAAQDQIAAFFASDGGEVIDPDGPDPLFETPIVPPLPEDVVFFP